MIAFVYGVYFTTLTNRRVRCFTASQGQGCSRNVWYLILSNCLAVFNQNMYTPNLHIGILDVVDNTTSVEVVGALRELLLKPVKISLVKTTRHRCVTEIVSSVTRRLLFKLYFSSSSEQISQIYVTGMVTGHLVIYNCPTHHPTGHPAKVT